MAPNGVNRPKISFSARFDHAKIFFGLVINMK